MICTRLAAILSQSIDFDSIDSEIRYRTVSKRQKNFNIAYDIARSFRFRVRNFEDVIYFRCSFSKSQNRYRGSISVEARCESREIRTRTRRKFERFEQEVRDNTFAEGGKYEVSVYNRKMPVSLLKNL